MIHAELLATVEGVASGDMEGHGRWSFTTDVGMTEALARMLNARLVEISHAHRNQTMQHIVQTVRCKRSKA